MNSEVKVTRKRLRRFLGRSTLGVVLALTLFFSNLYLPAELGTLFEVEHVHAATEINGLWCQTCGEYVTDFKLKPISIRTSWVDGYDDDDDGYADDYSYEAHYPCIAKTTVLIDGVEHYRYVFGFSATASDTYEHVYSDVSIPSWQHVYMPGNITTASTSKLYFRYSGGISTDTISLHGVSQKGDVSFTNVQLQIVCNSCTRPLVTVNEGGNNLPIVSWCPSTDLYYWNTVYSNTSKKLAFNMTNSDVYVGFPEVTLSASYNTNALTSDNSLAIANLIQGLVEMVLNLNNNNTTTTGTVVYNVIPADGIAFTWNDLCTAVTQVTPSGTTYKGFPVFLDLMGYSTSGICSHTVSFNANGGTGTMADVKVDSGDSITLTNSFTRAGYTFKGWATSASGSVVYTNGQTITPTSDLTLYAVWEVTKYTITYNANGGTGSMTASSIPSTGGTLTSNAFTRTGYTFSGWSTSASGSTTYSNGATIYPSANTTLYAVWSINKNSVTLNNTGSGASGAATSVAYGTKVTINAGTKTGYTFDNWTISSGSGVTLANANSASTTFTMPNCAVSLTANWKANNYNVTYKDVDIDTGTVLKTQTVQKAYGTTVAGSDLGTSTTLGTYYANYVYQDCTSAVVGTSGATVTRYFKLMKYKITFNANGGTGTMSDAEITAGNSITLSNKFTRTGYTFAGWATSSDGSVLYVDNAMLYPTGNMTVYAKWNPLPFKVTIIDKDLARDTELGTTIIEAAYETTVDGSVLGNSQTVGEYYTGYALTSTTSVKVSMDADVNIVYRYFAPQKYTVTVVDMIDAEDIELGRNDIQKIYGDTARGAEVGTNSPYEGYSYSSDTSAEVTEAGAVVYRYFVRNPYNVTYIDIVKTGEYTVSGEILKNEVVTKAYGSAISGEDYGDDTTLNAYYDGYRYTGECSSSTVSVDPSLNVVYRIFEPGKFDVHYIDVVGTPQGRVLNEDIQSEAEWFGNTVNAAVKGTDSTEGAYYAGYSYVSCSQDIVGIDGAYVYRMFEPVTYALEFELNGGELEENVTTYEFGTTVGLPTPKRAGYTFRGWYDNELFNDSAITEIVAGTTGNKKFYAKWSVNTYEVLTEFEGAGATVKAYRAGEEVPVDEIQYEDVVTVTFGTRENSKFLSYDITDGAAVLSETSDSVRFVMPDSDVTVSVYWNQCTDVSVVFNNLFTTTYKVSPRFVDGKYNIDVTPQMEIREEMLSVAGIFLNTKTQKMSTENLTKFAFDGDAIVDTIGTNTFILNVDVFGDSSYLKPVEVSVDAFSSALDNLMSSSGATSYTELETFIIAKSTELDECTELVEKLEATLTTETTQKNEYAQKLVDAQQKVNELNLTIAAKEKELLENGNTTSTEINKLKQEAQNLQYRIESLTKSNSQLETTLKETQQKSELTTTNVTKSQYENENLKQQIESLQSQLKDAIAARDELSIQKDTLQEQSSYDKSTITNSYEELLDKKDQEIIILREQIAQQQDALSKPALGGAYLESLGNTTEGLGGYPGVDNVPVIETDNTTQQTTTEDDSTDVQTDFVGIINGKLEDAVLQGFLDANGEVTNPMLIPDGSACIGPNGEIILGDGTGQISVGISGKSGTALLSGVHFIASDGSEGSGFTVEGGYVDATGRYWGPGEFLINSDGELCDLDGKTIGYAYHTLYGPGYNSETLGGGVQPEWAEQQEDKNTSVLGSILGFFGIGTSSGGDTSMGTPFGVVNIALTVAGLSAVIAIITLLVSKLRKKSRESGRFTEIDESEEFEDE